MIHHEQSSVSIKKEYLEIVDFFNFFQVKMLKVKLLLKVLHLCMENFLRMVTAPQKWILK